MSRTYKATGINLRGKPIGESDRILTIFTREWGLIQAVAPGARKHQSHLRGRAELFIVNDLLIAKGRSLDRIIQADTVASYPRLSQDLGKLAAAQYLAELILYQSPIGNQDPLFLLLSEHLNRLEQLPGTPAPSTCVQIIAYLTHGLFHLLAWAGIAPQVQYCSRTQHPLIPQEADPNWRARFSIEGGGIFLDSPLTPTPSQDRGAGGATIGASSPRLIIPINSVQLAILQQLAKPQLPELTQDTPGEDFLHWQEWIFIERILRQYAEYHLDCSIRSASLIDACFPTPNHRFPSQT